ncbi:MAG: hypothetical protein JWM53_2505 [bacterium]|nr:hypothetical protein [bacterium]
MIIAIVISEISWNTALMKKTFHGFRSKATPLSSTGTMNPIHTKNAAKNP